LKVQSPAILQGFNISKNQKGVKTMENIKIDYKDLTEILQDIADAVGFIDSMKVDADGLADRLFEDMQVLKNHFGLDD
jgi:hypothetical protein